MPIDQKAFSKAIDAVVAKHGEEAGISLSVLKSLIEAYEAAKAEQPDERTAFEQVDFSKGYGGAGSNDRNSSEAYASDKTKWRFEGYTARLAATKREAGDEQIVRNTALGVILNYRDIIPAHIVKWAESKLDHNDIEVEAENG